MIRCGLRPGEAFALRHGDVDLAKEIIHIERSVTETGHIKATKTYEERDVDISGDPRLVALLRQYVPWLQDTAVRQGWENSPLFPSISGTFLDAANVRRDMKALLKSVPELPNDRTPYDLRHTYVTHSLTIEREDLGFVSQQIGHQSITTTLEYYYHYLPENWKKRRSQSRKVRPADKKTELSATKGATNAQNLSSEKNENLETTTSEELTWSRRVDSSGFEPPTC